jgi:menaquinone-dependent protoporphyrinogen oxidase
MLQYTAQCICSFGVNRGGTSMRVLVAYETGHGSTAGIAEAIGQAMQAAGAEVTIQRCRDVQGVTGFDAFVIGSPIWAGKWLKPAARFLKQNALTLLRLPTAIFLATGADGDAHLAMVMRDYVPKVTSIVPEFEPVSVGNFAGMLNFPKYSILVRLLMIAINRFVGGPTSGVHDYRDWDAIEAWAEETYDLFVRHSRKPEPE